LQLKTLSAERVLQLPFVHRLSGLRDFSVSMHPDIQTVRIEVELQAHFRYTARVVIFTGTRLIAFGSHQSLLVVRRGGENVRSVTGQNTRPRVSAGW